MSNYFPCAFRQGEVILDGLRRLGVNNVHAGAAGAPRAAAGGGVALQLPVLHAIDRGRPVRHARKGRAAPLARPPLHRQDASAEACVGEVHLSSVLCLQPPPSLNHVITFQTPQGRLQCREQAPELRGAHGAPGTFFYGCA